jgi:YVTN family beta-propeller protein
MHWAGHARTAAVLVVALGMLLTGVTTVLVLANAPGQSGLVAGPDAPSMPSGGPSLHASLGPSPTHDLASQSGPAVPTYGAANVTVSPTTGVVGSNATATGRGFLPSQTLEATFGAGALTFTACSNGTATAGGTSVVASAAGTFACTFMIPASPHGPQRLAVTGAPVAGISTNRSSVTVIATVSVGAGPWGAALDPAQGELFVSDLNGASVTVVSVSTQQAIATIPVGSRPHGVAYDSGTGQVFVTNYYPGSPNGTVSVINDTTDVVVKNITVGAGPFWVTYDPKLGELFVSDFNSNDIKVINDRTDAVVATIPVDTNPQVIAYDPATGQMFVTFFTGNVSVISTTTNTVVATLTIGLQPWGLAYDAAKGEWFVPQAQGNRVYVINDTTDKVVANVTAGADLTGAAFDAATGMVYVADLNGAYAGGSTPGSLVVINASSNTVAGSVPVAVHPIEPVYDPSTGNVFVTDEYSDTVSVVENAGAFVPFGVLSSASITSALSGLPGSNVTVSGQGYAADSPITFSISGGTIATQSNCSTNSVGSFTYCTFVVPSEIPGTYNVTATDGASNANSNRMTFSITAPAAFTVTLVETGLAPGATWQVTLSSQSSGATIAVSAPTASLAHSAAAGSAIVFHVSSGQYNFVASSSGYASASGGLTVAQISPPVVTVNFALISPGPGPGNSTAPGSATAILSGPGGMIGLVLVAIATVGLGLTAYRYRARQRMRGDVLVTRLFEVAGPADGSSIVEEPSDASRPPV